MNPLVRTNLAYALGMKNSKLQVSIFESQQP
jgi:hypothetical protein